MMTTSTCLLSLRRLLTMAPPFFRLTGSLKPFRRILFLVLGFLNLSLAYLGWLLPGLPWSPFVVMASFCFSKSSPRMERWLLNNRLFGAYLRDMRDYRGIRKNHKIKATCMVVLVVSCSVIGLYFAGKPWYVWSVIPPLALIGICTMWFAVRTVPDHLVKASDLL